MVLLFVATSFLTATLLFLVQPMVGRMVLPAFGGSPQVWTTSMLFFQVALLAGYGYTHLTTTRLARGSQPWLHLAVALVPLAALPIALTVAPSGRGGLAPSVELLAALAVGVAAPFVLVATSGPLLQRWFSWTDHPRAHDPYFLYAAGNVGSAAGLLAYPFLLEPYLSITDQSRVWTAGYVTALVLLSVCAVVVRRQGGAPATPVTLSGAASDEPPASTGAPSLEAGTDGMAPAAVTPRQQLRWLGYAFIPSSLMLGATSVLSTDIAAVPLLWIAPLGTYLLTFTIAFSGFGPRALRVASRFAPVVVVAAIAIRPDAFGVLVAVAAQLLLVLVAGILAHGRLAAERPGPAHLTRFYLVVAVGGAFGGVFNGLVAPVVFPAPLEYGIAMVLTLGLVVRWRQFVVGAGDWAVAVRLPVGVVLGLIPALLLLLVMASRLPASLVLRGVVVAVLLAPLATRLGRSGAVGTSVILVALLPQLVPLSTATFVDRTFFGVHRVVQTGAVRELIHGTTVHGIQDFTTEESRRRAASYYHPAEPLGDVMRLPSGRGTVGAIGLGAGAVAAYGQPGQTFVFHEIDPAVVDIARHQFSYLADSQADVEVVLGDGRLTIASVNAEYGVLVVDAFSSDAVPVHLLTVEAIATYLDAVEDGGVVAVHVSNRYLDLTPVLTAATDRLGISGVAGWGDGDADGATPSQWVALARQTESLDGLRLAGWTDLAGRRVSWTDQRSSLWSVVRR